MAAELGAEGRLNEKRLSCNTPRPGIEVRQDQASKLQAALVDDIPAGPCAPVVTGVVALAFVPAKGPPRQGGAQSFALRGAQAALMNDAVIPAVVDQRFAVCDRAPLRARFLSDPSGPGGNRPGFPTTILSAAKGQRRCANHPSARELPSGHLGAPLSRASMQDPFSWQSAGDVHRALTAAAGHGQGFTDTGTGLMFRKSRPESRPVRVPSYAFACPTMA